MAIVDLPADEPRLYNTIIHLELAGAPAYRSLRRAIAKRCESNLAPALALSSTLQNRARAARVIYWIPFGPAAGSHQLELGLSVVVNILIMYANLVVKLLYC